MTSNGHDSAKPLRTGDPSELGDYAVLGRLGRGGMGTVYLARNPAGQKVAVKLIHPDLTDDEDFRRRFAREVESARRVARFSTAGVIDARLDGEPLFIVSEYVAGPNLSEAIGAEGPMAGGTLDGLAMGVAAALTAIHGAGVIHRDLKPANVLLSTVGPKVIDFGIARAMDDDGAVTRSSQLMGTPAYLAPELIAGARDITPASDIFSWGCLVAFAGLGRAPFDAPTVPAVLHQISSMAPNLTGLDPSLSAMVTAALEKDPANRPTAQQLLNRLVGQEDPSDSVVDQTVVRSWTPPSTSRPVGAAAVLPPPPGEGPGTPPGGGPAAGSTDPTADMAGPRTAAMPPHDQPPAQFAGPQGAPPGPGPQGAGQQGYVQSGPPQGAGMPPSGPQYAQGFVPSGPQGAHPGVPPAGRQPGFAGVDSPPHGQNATRAMPPGPPPYGGHNGPGGPGGFGPNGPGYPPGAVPPGGAPKKGLTTSRKALIGGSAALVLVVAAASAVFFLRDPSFPEGSVVYQEDFDSGESEWTDDFSSEFDEDSEFGHTDRQFALRATEDEPVAQAWSGYDSAHPGHLGVSTDLTWAGGPEYAQAGLFCFGYDADDEDLEEDFRQYEVMMRKDGAELVIRRNAGTDGSGTLFKAAEVAGYDDAEDAVNTVQVTCDLELPEPEADMEEGTVTVRAWVNGEFAGEAVDQRPLPGHGTGLMVHRTGGGSGGESVAQFDNFLMTETAPSEEPSESP